MGNKIVRGRERVRGGGGRGTRDRGARDTSDSASGRLLRRHWRDEKRVKRDEKRGSTIHQSKQKNEVACSAAHVAHTHTHTQSPSHRSFYLSTPTSPSPNHISRMEALFE